MKLFLRSWYYLPGLRLLNHLESSRVFVFTLISVWFLHFGFTHNTVFKRRWDRGSFFPRSSALYWLIIKVSFSGLGMSSEYKIDVRGDKSPAREMRDAPVQLRKLSLALNSGCFQTFSSFWAVIFSLIITWSLRRRQLLHIFTMPAHQT